MALHFSSEEFARRRAALDALLAERKLDCLLIFSQESMYWLSGYDSFGFCFFQCLIYRPGEEPILLTRSPDLRQARHTSNINDIRVWIDVAGKSPVSQVKDMLFELELLGTRIGVEFDSHGLTAARGRELDDSLRSFADIEDASYLISSLRLTKSEEELVYVRKAAELADQAFTDALAATKPGANEADILAAMHHAIFEGGGDYAANEFVLGSGRDALLCRPKSGRRTLADHDQMTVELAGAYRRYHAALMRTVVIGEPTPRHLELHQAACAALSAIEDKMRPGFTFGDLFDAHATELDSRGLTAHRISVCAYSLGARFAPSWMDAPYLAYKGNPQPIEANMVLFAPIMLMDSDSETAMTLGRSYIVADNGPEPLSQLSLDLPQKLL
ncbi:M24 family metallopeptidase [Polycladidibacter hongkongensis]|uniref:M24 family metallopeptidase n=1 Tax=Polycladidibacter hongkongensis TaxID=1647556 RepID=UPI000833B838|nr:Xaa-Pro peptidase family protein [Pseudovibrio hongkongensis]